MKYILTILLLFFFTSPILAYDCPFGRVNDPAPGQCGVLYTDQNNDGICDNGQDLAVNENKTESQASSGINYYFWQIFLAFIVWQLLAISLLEYQKLSLATLKKLNNYCLLSSFILTAVTGLLFIINLVYSIKIIEPRLVSWLHLEFGFIMILFSLEHALRRWQSFLK